jgi:hypothetical protein
MAVLASLKNQWFVKVHTEFRTWSSFMLSANKGIRCLLVRFTTVSGEEKRMLHTTTTRQNLDYLQILSLRLSTKLMRQLIYIP